VSRENCSSDSFPDEHAQVAPLACGGKGERVEGKARDDLQQQLLTTCFSDSDSAFRRWAMHELPMTYSTVFR